MANYVKYDDVCKLATVNLQMDGKGPSVRTATRLLGRGSATTISKHLRRWTQEERLKHLKRQQQHTDSMFERLQSVFGKISDRRIYGIVSKFKSMAESFDWFRHKLTGTLEGALDPKLKGSYNLGNDSYDEECGPHESDIGPCLSDMRAVKHSIDTDILWLQSVSNDLEPLIREGEQLAIGVVPEEVKRNFKAKKIYRATPDRD